MRKTKKKPILIIGPCAAESKEQIQQSIDEAKRREIDFMRISLWKPRTKPGFEGLQEDGLELLAMAAQQGVNPGSEVILPSHAEKVIETVLNASKTANVLIWIGARNQNHYIQQEISRVAKGEKRVFLMVKNQPWPSEDHWEGIIEHVLHGGIAEDHLFLCHRGFTPQGYENPWNMRNVPDFEMAMRIKEKSKLPMLFDPSHIGGNVENVIRVAEDAAKQPFDGLIVEVHPEPKNALTDAKQQLTWKQFDKLHKPKPV